MFKRISIAAVVSLALVGCTSQSQPEQSNPTTPPETAAEKAKSDTNPNETKDGFGTYTVTDTTGTVYTLDLNKPFDYSTDLIEKSNEVMAKALDIDKDEMDQIVQWSTLEIDNTQGNEEGSASMVAIQVVGDEMQYDIITEAGMYFNEMTTDYTDDESLSTDDYNEVVDIGNEWYDQDMDAKPGVKLTVPAIVSDIPETIETVWYNDMEMELKK